MEGPTGLYRSIMYKGIPDKDALQRTPSAWLLPDSNRITIRVSTVDNPDEGIIIIFSALTSMLIEYIRYYF